MKKYTCDRILTRLNSTEFKRFGEAHYHRTADVNLIVAMALISRCVSDTPQFFILWGNFTHSFVLRPPVHSLQTVFSTSTISATLPLVPTEPGALAGDFPTGPTGILLIYPV